MLENVFIYACMDAIILLPGIVFARTDTNRMFHVESVASNFLARKLDG